MRAIIDNLRKLGGLKLAALGATGLGVTLAVLFGLGAVMRADWTPLYSDLSPAAASQVVATLEQAGFRVDLGAGGSVVSVPAPDVARARMALAEQGLPNEGTPGWELFDGASGLGMNGFMQQVTRLRALEGELARSIQTIDGIEAARVHLVLPEREAFSRERAEASASIILRAQTGRQVGRAQAQAIRALVASSVAGLAPARVTVLSASGETILSEDGESAAEITMQTVRAGIEERMAAQVQQILTARVGAGNARVQVNVDLSNERQVIRSQSYDPDQQVVRSTDTRERNEEGQEFRREANDVGGNLPDALAGDETRPASTSTSTDSEEQVRYEIGSTQTETVREPGEIERVSVAVLVNGIYAVGDGGAVAYQERDAAELERLEALVRSAIGFDEARGDLVQVDSLRFMDYSMDVGEPVGQGLAGVLSANLGALLRGLFAVAILALVLLLAVRPVLRRLLPDPGMAQIGEQEGAPALTADPAQDEAGQGLPAPLDAGRRDAGADAGQEDGLYDPLRGAQGDYVNLATVTGEIGRTRLAALGELVQVEPEQSLRVLRGWLSQEG
ncbi:flagellar basal-body MS-ring/collar protein FliF [Pseudoroseicyclus aestuarii]|uniref:flagellar basal-body MS-ring/collar protein FliF n=1 Tax=Pseudoroseicyclus aestuarii TaxID=1795041 RepID=UPI000DA24E6F|nr:flagellar basal-body MS-ring/collar protein FliF [Pseudoroseicyclus aestuarii]